MLAHKVKTERRFNYAEYCTWPDNERWELINGEAYNMSPAPSNKHQEIAGEIFRQIANYLKGKNCEIRFAPFDIRLPEANEADDYIETVVQPDIVVVCDSSKMDEKGLKGAPDIAIEILSPSTAKKDLTVKKDLYEKNGVREYWIFHPTDEIVFIYRLEDGRYNNPIILGSEDILKSIVLAELEIKLEDVFV